MSISDVSLIELQNFVEQSNNIRLLRCVKLLEGVFRLFKPWIYHIDDLNNQVEILKCFDTMDLIPTFHYFMGSYLLNNNSTRTLSESHIIEAALHGDSLAKYKLYEIQKYLSQ